MMQFIYLLGVTFGRFAMGAMTGLCLIELYEQSRGERGPIYTALIQQKPGIIFAIIFVLSLTGVYSILVDIVRVVL